jgi:DNA-binding transcriptional LysR family regulator
MNWNNLHILAVLSREGSLAGAARALGVNHATISRRLAALEDEVGAGLVRRLARSTPLTEKGQEIAALAIEMEQQARKIERLKNLPGGGVSGTVRLSAPPAFLSESLMPKLSGITETHPDLRLVFVAETRVTSLEQGHADIAVRLTEPVAQNSIVRKLGEISYALYGTAQHVKRPSEAWRFIGFDRDFAHMPLQKWLANFAGGRPFDLVSNDFHVQKAAAETSLGLALMPDLIARQSPHLERANAPTPPPLTAWLVIHPDVKNAPEIRIMADAILSVFQDAET